MRRSLIIFGLVAQAHAAPGLAGEVAGTTLARVEPSFGVLRTKARALVSGRGDAGWSLGWQSTTSRASLDERVDGPGSCVARP